MASPGPPHPSHALVPASTRHFAARLALVVGTALVVWFFYLTIQLWLVFFASILGAVVLSALSRWIAGLTHLPRGLCLALILGLLLAGLMGVAWWAFPPVAREVENFVDDWPALLQRFHHTWLGRRLFENDGRPLLDALGSMGAPMFGTAMTIGAVISQAGVGLFLALFLAATPARHVAGVRRAFPPGLRQPAGEFLEECGRALERWLIGQVIAMAVIATIMIAALRLLGVSYPYTLGLLAGLCQFVPYVGPLLWAVPASLIAATHSWTEAAIVLGVYLVVQVFEGNLLTPMIQRRAVELPPVVTILGTVVLGLMFGPLGIMLATPLLVVALVVYDRFWIRRIED